MNRPRQPAYYQGRFMPDQSVVGLSDRSASRPPVFGTLTAADAGALGSRNYQMPGRSPAAGIINFSSNGVFNLPRYYPNYQQFDNEDNNDDDDDIGSTWRSGDHQRTIPFYRDQPLDDNSSRSDPIYSKPNKGWRGSGSSGVFSSPREQFTVALGSDFDTQPRRSRGCCGRKSSCFRGCETRCRGRRSCRSCCCCWRRQICRVRPICVCTTVALILLAVVAVSVAVFLAVFLIVTRPSDDVGGGSTDLTTVVSLMSPGSLEALQLSVVLRVDSSYRAVYDNLTADETRRVTAEFCDALTNVLDNITEVNSSLIIATVGDNCTAVGYTNGSTLAEFILSCSRTSRNVDDSTLVTAVNASLVTALSHSNNSRQRFEDVLNASVTLHSLRIYHQYYTTEPTTTATTVTNRTVYGSTSQPVTSSMTSLAGVEQTRTTTVNDTVVVVSSQTNATVPTNSTISSTTSSTNSTTSSTNNTTPTTITTVNITTTYHCYNLTTSWSLTPDNTMTKMNSNTSSTSVD